LAYTGQQVITANPYSCPRFLEDGIPYELLNLGKEMSELIYFPGNPIYTLALNINILTIHLTYILGFLKVRTRLESLMIKITLENLTVTYLENNLPELTDSCFFENQVKYLAYI
jgi:hypothetical protein